MATQISPDQVTCLLELELLVCKIWKKFEAFLAKTAVSIHVICLPSQEPLSTAGFFSCALCPHRFTCERRRMKNLALWSPWSDFCRRLSFILRLREIAWAHKVINSFIVLSYMLHNQSSQTFSPFWTSPQCNDFGETKRESEKRLNTTHMTLFLPPLFSLGSP